MDIKAQAQYWLDGAEHDLPAAESLFGNGHYAWCLYLGHLVLEKTLKAMYVLRHKKLPPRTHDLIRLAHTVSLELTPEQEKTLSRITDFNIEARYPDQKLQFYRLCTREFTQRNFSEIKEMRQWLKSQMP